MATIARVQSKAQSNPSGTNTLTMTSGPTAGNLIVLAVRYSSTEATLTENSGTYTAGTLVSSGTTSARSIRLFWKIAGAGESATINWTPGTAAANFSDVAEFSSDTGWQATPKDVENAQTNVSGTSTTPSVSPTGAQQELAAFFLMNKGTSNAWSLEALSGSNVGAVTEELDASGQTLCWAVVSATTGAYQGSGTASVAGVGAGAIAFFLPTAGTTFSGSGSATQAQSLSVAETLALARTVSATQAQAATAALARTFARAASATQAQAVSLARAVTLTRSLTQAQALSLVRQVALIRAITQAQVASVVAGRLRLTVVSATQAQGVALRQAAGLARATTQAQAVSITRIATFRRTVSATQAQALAALGIARGAVVSATQAQVASLVAVFRAFSRGNGSFSNPEVVIDSVDGYSASAVTSGQYLIESVFAYRARIGGVQVHADTAGTGTGSTTVDILLNGSSIYHTASDRPTLAVASTGAFTQASPPADTALNRGDQLAIQVVTVPTTTGHARVKAQVAIERPLRRGV